MYMRYIHNINVCILRYIYIILILYVIYVNTYDIP